LKLKNINTMVERLKNILDEDNLNKRLKAKFIGFWKIIVLSLLFSGAVAYAFLAMKNLVYNSEYSRTLSFQSLRLDKSKQYIFVRDFSVIPDTNTILIPIGRVNMPDSLGILFHNGTEWRLRLTDRLRKNDEDDTIETIFYPFCRRLNAPYPFRFFHYLDTPTQSDLKAGVLFNNASRRDRFIIQIKEQNGEYYLTRGVAAFRSRNVPISNKRQNDIELNFFKNSSTSDNSKFVFNFPIFGSQNQPERRFITIIGDSINYDGIFKPIEGRSLYFSINDCVFLLKNNYNNRAKTILPLLFSFLVIFSISMLIRLFVLIHRKTRPSGKRNLIQIEQFNLLSLRVLFNCIILLGFPILLLKVQGDESRLWSITLLAFALNINWIVPIKYFSKIAKKCASWLSEKTKKLTRCFSEKTKSIAFYGFSVFLVFAAIIAIWLSSSNELVVIGSIRIPVLKVTALIFVFLPFAFGFIKKHLLKTDVFNKFATEDNGQHSSREDEQEEKQKTLFSFSCYLLATVIAFIIALLSSDSATFMFTLLGVLLMFFINIRGLWRSIKTGSFYITRDWRDIKVSSLSLLLILIIALFIIGGFLAFGKINAFGIPFSSIMPNKWQTSLVLGIFLMVVFGFVLFKLFKRFKTPLKGFAIAMVVISCFGGFWLSDDMGEKEYRFLSVIKFPNDTTFDNNPNFSVYASRETIANKIFILNSVGNRFSPDFKTIVLPENRSVFWNDYAILWSFRIGGWSWFWLYFGVLFMLAYTIVSLLIIFSKTIKLDSTHKKASYNTRIIIGLNLLLAILLVQYFYTFLGNFWTLPLTGQSPGLLSPSNWEYVFHIILINYLYVYLVSTIESRKEAIQQSTTQSAKTFSYVRTKIRSSWFPFLVFLLCIGALFFQRNKINSYIRENNEMSWEIVQDNAVISHYIGLRENYGKDTLRTLAHGSFAVMRGNAQEQRRFRNLLRIYHQSDDVRTRHRVTTEGIAHRTNIDSITNIRSEFWGIDFTNCDFGDSVIVFHKFANSSPVRFISNRYYGGCPPGAETIIFELQGNLNRALKDWARRINAHSGFKMLGGSIIIAENNTGYIRASASYPLIYNHNLFSILYEERRINDILRQHNVVSRIRINRNDRNYINFSEQNMIPGSIVKPLLVYAGLHFLPPNTFSKTELNNILGRSQNPPTERMFRSLFVENDYFNDANILFRNDFGFPIYNRHFRTDRAYHSHAIGLQQPLIFRNIVQAYMRIGTGRKIELTYEKRRGADFDKLSLDSTQLEVLRTAMRSCLQRGGTAYHHIGRRAALGIADNGYLAKTGTAQIEQRVGHNNTSAFIIVTERYTIGIQLFGIVPGATLYRATGENLHATGLFRELVQNEIITLR